MTKAELIEKAESLGLKVQEGSTNKEIKKLIEAKEAELAETDVETEEEANSEEEKSPEEVKAELLKKGIYVDDRGRKYRFTKDAPKQLNIDGAPMTQKEILETEEVISELVYGNNGFITQVTHEL
jgi:hypothetical protein